ncbi:hypothetical protein NCCP1664_17900 [Zafaria cholistanensis]|uniref:DUF1468 domain-containing protein n=1 Tax=Zafaria cholistanensis TaxID=1682741 RepID=A0A5A7NQT1_9MICC|nr:tripartite tricarboxylate transporter TctB family protein [Zafaria cholistanensis]GER23294.1 hypothetical protein NCCP1664_17900 [Zafaria cholistanensis]
MGVPTRRSQDTATQSEEVGVVEADVDDEAVTPAGAWSHLVAGGVPLAFGVVMMLGSINLGLGSPTSPQPGLWPFALSVLLIALSIGLLVGRGRFGPCESFGSGTLTVIAGVGSIAAFTILLPLIGFEIPAIVLAAFWLKILGQESWRVVAMVPILCTAAFHLLFVEGLGVAIPHLFSF